MSETIDGHDFAFRKKQNIHVPLAEYLSNTKTLTYIGEMIIRAIKDRGMIDIDSFLHKLKNIKVGNNTVAVWK